jgi:hypothetical protein
VIEEREIWGCALEMVRQHGIDAATYAAMKADKLMKRGDIEGQRVWCRIMTRAEQLLKGENGIH